MTTVHNAELIAAILTAGMLPSVHHWTGRKTSGLKMQIALSAPLDTP